jgi:hypothetical protein
LRAQIRVTLLLLLLLLALMMQRPLASNTAIGPRRELCHYYFIIIETYERGRVVRGEKTFF